MHIKVDDLQGVEIYALLEEHLRDMHTVSPPGSVHALDIEALRHPSITFWSAWDGGQLLGCCALKVLNADHAELKSMRTAHGHLRKGVASSLLTHVLLAAKTRSYKRVSLETGSMPAFEPARTLYAQFGFKRCKPFSDYWDDPNSVFMSLEINI